MYNDIHCTVAGVDGVAGVVGVAGVAGIAGVVGVVGGMWLIQLSHNRRYICIRYTYCIFYKNILLVKCYTSTIDYTLKFLPEEQRKANLSRP